MSPDDGWARLGHTVLGLGRIVSRVPGWLLLGFFRLWQLLASPTYGQTCRFYPSCSAYGVRAVSEHGAVRGGWLTVRRVLRCHPWNPGGFDPVPPTGRTGLPADHDESVPPMRRVA
jgi:putative membrane protein insertion efficiency factor